MTTVESWNLLFNGFTAISTTSAVCISLWFALGKKKRFSVIEKEIRFELNRAQSTDGRMIDMGNFIYIRLENHLDVEMRVFHIDISYKTLEGLLQAYKHLKCDGGQIPALSQYNIKIKIPRIA